MKITSVNARRMIQTRVGDYIKEDSHQYLSKSSFFWYMSLDFTSLEKKVRNFSQWGDEGSCYYSGDRVLCVGKYGLSYKDFNSGKTKLLISVLDWDFCLKISFRFTFYGLTFYWLSNRLSKVGHHLRKETVLHTNQSY